ncbi:MAG: DUF885 family protein [bacterium]
MQRFQNCQWLTSCLFIVFVFGLFQPAHTQAHLSEKASAKLHRLFEEFWEYTLKENPLLATSRGDLRYNDRLPEESPQAFQRRNQANLDFMNRLREIDREQLSPEDRLNYDLFEEQLLWEVEEFKFATYLEAVHQRSGFHLSLPQMHERVPFQTRKHYEDYLARLQAIPLLIDEQIALLKEGLKRGITPPKLVLEAVPAQIEKLVAMSIPEFPLFEPFKSFPRVFSETEQDNLKQRGQQVLEEEVVPAFGKFKRFFSGEYIPKATTEIAASRRYPKGDNFYRFRIRRFTTTDLTAKEIHEIGLKEVARIRKRMHEIIQKTGFQGSFEEFTQSLRTDARFYYTKPEQLLRGYRDICKRMDAALPRLFGKLPRAPYGVRPVPEYAAPQATTAYYNRPSADGTQPGWFYANTYDLRSRPKYEMETLALHESVPGHHLQIALQQELENVPAFRTIARYTAFVEGWGLYAESLGKEVGFYQDPYSEFGFLSYEMWRALRLVVDTGIHAFGWSREQAIDYMLENSALTRTNVKNEVDRYIAWPGQALAYKIGQLKIRELRNRAEDALGEAFDIRAFHDLVLSAGAIPLDVLERRVSVWIEEKQKS